MRDRKDFDRCQRLLAEIKTKHPDLRLGQIIVCALPPRFDSDPFYIEDDKLADGLQAFLEGHPPKEG